MQRIEFYLSYDDGQLDSHLKTVIDRMIWLKDTFGEGQEIANQNWFSRLPEITQRWAFGTYQTLPINPIKFCLWLPDDIKLLHDIQWPH